MLEECALNWFERGEEGVEYESDWQVRNLCQKSQVWIYLEEKVSFSKITFEIVSAMNSPQTITLGLAKSAKEIHEFPFLHYTGDGFLRSKSSIRLLPFSKSDTITFIIDRDSSQIQIFKNGEEMLTSKANFELKDLKFFVGLFHKG